MADSDYGGNPEQNPGDYGDDAFDPPTVGAVEGSDHNSSSTPAVGSKSSEHNSPGATGNV